MTITAAPSLPPLSLNLAPLFRHAFRSPPPSVVRPTRYRRERVALAAVAIAAHALGLLALGSLGTTHVMPPELEPIQATLIPAARPELEPTPAAQPAEAERTPEAPQPKVESLPTSIPKPVARRPAPRTSPVPATAARPSPPVAEPVAAPAEPPLPAVAAPPGAPAQAAAPTLPSEAAAAPAPVSAARYDAAYLNNPPPAYPMPSRRLREEGQVILKVLVSPAGQPARIELSRSSGSARLDRAAQDAVGGWRFVPARQGDQAVEAWVLVPIVFKLQGN